MSSIRNCLLINIPFNIMKNIYFFLNSTVKNEILRELQNSDIFNFRNEFQLSAEEQKCLSLKKTLTILYSVNLKLKDLFNLTAFNLAYTKIIDQLNRWSFGKSILTLDLFPSSILALGTERHLQLYNDSYSGKIAGAFCLTEVGHGSDTKKIQTTAHYDKHNKEFVLHTPSFQAAKCWAGNIGKWATHAIVYAQLITPDEKVHGLHSFVVPLRDPKTMLPFSGIIIADLGEKIGYGGVDNGLVIFNNYRIPKSCLLNKLADVTDDGEYRFNIVDTNNKHAILLNSLSNGRFIAVCMANFTQIHALAIGVRYSVIRQGLSSKALDNELYINHFRLISHAASCYTTLLFVNYLHEHKNSELQDREYQMEWHGILCAAKPYFTFKAQEIVRDCKEVCSDLGLLCVSGISTIKNDYDANATFEGDNNVLMQQTGNWLLKFWPLIVLKKSITTPLGSLDFLNNALDILQLKFKLVHVKEFYKPENISTYYQWLVCYLLKRCYQKCNDLRSGKDYFWTRNNAQIFYLRNLSIAYFESFILKTVYGMVLRSTSLDVKSVLYQLISLYAVWNLRKHVSFFYEGLYADTALFAQLIEDSISLLCENLKDDVVCLVDVISLPDDVMQSILGHSDGQVHSRLFSEILQTKEAFSNEKLLNGTKSKL